MTGPVTVDDYLGRITPWQSNHPRFTATVGGQLAPIATAAAVVAGIPAAFDLETALGSQLDVDGEWVGRSRHVRLPIPQPWFSFADATRGFSQGVWKGVFSGTFGIVDLDDETYRRLLFANIAARHWDGTLPTAQAAFDIFFIDPETRVFLEDGGAAVYPPPWFSFGIAGRGFGEAAWYPGDADSATLNHVDGVLTIGVAGKIPPRVYLGLLAQTAIPIKPAGVEVRVAVTSVDRAALFGFGVQNQYVSGFGTGAWGATPDHILDT